MRPLTLLPFIAALLGAAALAQEAEAPALKGPKAPHRRWEDLKQPPLRKYTPPKAQRHELDNGLVVYLLEDHEIPLVDLVTLVRTGSVYETRDKAGLAGICGEVMRSGGTAEKTGDELDRTLEDMASSVEVGISATEGRASLSCLKENFDKTLPILLELLERPAFRKEKLELAKRQAKSAIARRNDEPYGIARREYTRLMYGDDSPFGWTTEVATIDAITREDLVEFHKSYFGIPNGTIVGVVGDFDARAMLEKIKITFGTWKPHAGVIAMPPVGLTVGDGPAPKPGSPNGEAGRGGYVHFIRKKDVNQATVILGHMGVRRTPDDPDHAPMIVLNNVLGGGGFSSRLMQHVRTDLGLAYGVGSRWAAHYAYKGTFGMSGQTKSETTLQMIAALRKELEAVLEEPVRAEELKVAKDALAQEMIFESETRAQVLERALRYEYYGFPHDYLERFQANIAKVTAEDCLRVAKKHLHPEKLVTLVVGNDEKFDGKLSTLGEVVEVDISRPAWPRAGETSAAAGAAEPSAEALAKGHELIEKAVAAKGGRQALEAVKTIVVKGAGTRQTQMGPMQQEVSKTIAFPDKVRLEMSIMGQKMVLCVDGERGWIQAPQGVDDLPESKVREIREQAEKEPVALLLALAGPGARPVYAGRQKLGDAAEVDLVEAGDMKLAFAGDGRLVGRLQKTGEGELTFLWSDFRAVSGVLFPFGSRVLMNGEEMTSLTASSIEVNVEVAAEAFKKPEGPEMKLGAPPPGGGQPPEKKGGAN